MKFNILVWSAGQCLETHKVVNSEQKENILRRLNSDLKKKVIKVRAGSFEIVTNVLCVDIYPLDKNEESQKMIEMNIKC